MSWASTITGSVSTPNKSSRDGRKVNGWIIHHNAATGGRGVLEMMRTGSKQVSANYQVLQNGAVWGVVPREERSWSASNAAWDGASLTFEIANNSGAPGWTISEEAYASVARTIAEDAAWAGIPINRTTVRGHREGSAQGAGGSYSTACPGGIDLDRLVNLANSFRSGTAGRPGVPIIPTPLGGNMFLIYDAEAGRKPDQRQYVLVTVDSGQIRARYLEDKFERAVIVGQVPNLPVTACDKGTFEGFLAGIGYAYKQPIPLPVVKVDNA